MAVSEEALLVEGSVDSQAAWVKAWAMGVSEAAVWPQVEEVERPALSC